MKSFFQMFFSVQIKCNCFNTLFTLNKLRSKCFTIFSKIFGGIPTKPVVAKPKCIMTLFSSGTPTSFLNSLVRRRRFLKSRLPSFSAKNSSGFNLDMEKDDLEMEWLPWTLTTGPRLQTGDCGPCKRSPVSACAALTCLIKIVT